MVNSLQSKIDSSVSIEQQRKLINPLVATVNKYASLILSRVPKNKVGAFHHSFVKLSAEIDPLCHEKSLVQKVLKKAQAIGESFLCADQQLALPPELLFFSASSMYKAEVEHLFKESDQKNKAATLEPIYEEVISRLSEEEKAALKETMAKIPDLKEKAMLFSKALLKNECKDSIFYSENFSYYALEALRLQLISQDQFGSLQIFWSIGQYHNGYKDVKEVPLFLDNGSVNKEAFEMIKETLHQKRHPFLQEEEFLEFIEELKKAPLSEQRFFVVPDIQEGLQRETISQRINSGVGVKVFSRSPSHPNLRMIPTLGMMQAILKVRFGKDAVKINAVLGLSDYSHMRKIDKRDMAIHFPGIKLPDIADSFYAPWYDFTWHDLYHAIVCSSIPIAYREWFLWIADFCLAKSKLYEKGSEQHQTWEALSFAAIDMEMSYFRSVHEKFILDPEAKFWVEVERLATKALINSNYEKFNPEIVLEFFKEVVEHLIIQGKGKDGNLDESSLKKALKLPRSKDLFSPLIDNLKPLIYILDVIKHHKYNKPLQSTLSPTLRNKIYKFKANVHFKKEIEVTFYLMDIGFAVEEINKELISFFKEKEDALQTLYALGFRYKDFQRLKLKDLQKLLSLLPEYEKLIISGYDWDELLQLDRPSLENLLKKARVIYNLTLSGFDIKKLNEKDFKMYKWLIDHYDLVLSFLEYGITPDELLDLTLHQLEKILSYELLELVKKGKVSITDLANLKSQKLQRLYSDQQIKIKNYIKEIRKPYLPNSFSGSELKAFILNNWNWVIALGIKESWIFDFINSDACQNSTTYSFSSSEDFLLLLKNRGFL